MCPPQFVVVCRGLMLTNLALSGEPSPCHQQAPMSDRRNSRPTRLSHPPPPSPDQGRSPQPSSDVSGRGRPVAQRRAGSRVVCNAAAWERGVWWQADGSEWDVRLFYDYAAFLHQNHRAAWKPQGMFTHWRSALPEVYVWFQLTFSIAEDFISNGHLAKHRSADSTCTIESDVAHAPLYFVCFAVSPSLRCWHVRPQALIRPVAMLLPDSVSVLEVWLTCGGFTEARTLARKLSTFFKLVSGQVTSECDSRLAWVPFTVVDRGWEVFGAGLVFPVSGDGATGNERMWQHACSSAVHSSWPWMGGVWSGIGVSSLFRIIKLTRSHARKASFVLWHFTTRE